MKLVYVAGPYRAPTGWGIEENVQRARRLGAQVAAAGAYPVIPHSNTSHMDGLAPDELWLAGTLELMRRCDAVVFAPDWERSSGAQAERAEVERLGVPCFFSVSELRDWLASAGPSLSNFDRIRALEAKCDLLSASLRKADAERAALVSELRHWWEESEPPVSCDLFAILARHEARS